MLSLAGSQVKDQRAVKLKPSTPRREHFDTAERFGMDLGFLDVSSFFSSCSVGSFLPRRRRTFLEFEHRYHLAINLAINQLQ